MKKFLSILLLAMMIMSLLIVSAYATDENGDVIIDIPIDGGEGDSGVTPPVTTTHTHCVCGGSAEGVMDHTCDETTEWSPISGSVDFGTLASGNYYLEGDVTVSACTSIKQDVQLNICLNGNDISGTKAIFGFAKPGSVISIADCSGEQGVDGTWTWDGTVTGTNVARGSVVCGGIFYLQSGATANIYGGNLTGTGTYQYGAIAYMQDEAKVDGYAVYPTFNVYNGRLFNSEGASATSGGLICAMSASAINLYGGILEGGVATSAGGNIYVAAAQDSNKVHRDVIIEGGTVTGGSANNGGNIESTARVYIRNGGTVSNGTATNNGGNIYTRWNVTLYDGGTISGGKATNGGGNAMSTTGCNINIYGGQVLGGEAKYGGSLYTYQGVIKIEKGLISGGKATGNGGSIAVEGSLVNNADGTTTEKKGTLMISGGTVEGGQAANGGSIAVVNAYCTATVSGGTITGGQSTNNGGNIQVRGGTFTLSGGTVEMGQSTKGNGGNINVTNGTFTMTDGTVEKGQSTKENGGNINVTGGTFTMTGGTVKDGTTAKSAANIYASDAYNIAIKGGTISGGTMKDVNYNGGSIRLIGSAGTFVIGVEGAEDGPTISAISQSVKAKGGIFYCDGGTVTMHSGTVTGGKVWGSSASYFGLGGNMYVKNLVMTGGTIKDGVAYTFADTNKNLHGGFGANVYVTGNLTMTGGTISGGTIEGGGSLAIGPNATATITDATITGAKNTQTGGPAGFGNGGNIYVDTGATLTLNNTTVSEGSAGKSGGNIYTLGTVIINGGTISGGTTTSNMGGSVAIVDGASVTVTGATVSGGQATGESAGNFYVAKGATLTLTDSIVTGGQAYSGGNIYCQGGTLTISGCQITDGYARKNGGNINVGSGSTFSMENTTVSGGATNLERTSSINTYGGNIYVAGTLNITDGIEITDGVSLCGGNVYAYVVNMTGGTVSGGKAMKHATAGGTGNGGNIYVDGNNASSISGGTITDGYAEFNGGNIYSKEMTVSGGTIQGGEAAKGGGNITIQGGCSVAMTGGTVSGGSAIYGGNVYSYGGTFDMQGGIVKDGTAKNYGGNIAMENSGSNLATCKISGTAQVMDGKTTNASATGDYPGGGNICADQFEMTGGTVSGGDSALNGGNIRANKECTITGGTITGGKAGRFGGNLWANNATITGDETGTNITISDGYAKEVGGNLCIASLLTASNVTISGGETAASGGNVWGKYLDWDNVTLIGGKAGNKGGNLFIGEQVADVESPRIIKNCQFIDGTGTTNGAKGGSVAIKLGTITIENTTISNSAEDLSGYGRCIYVENVGEMTLKNVTLTNTTGNGTTIWNEGTLTLVGELTINDNDAMDLMIDARINPDAALEISEYTGTDLILVRRWEQDAINDDAGIIAKGAKAEDVDKFMAWREGYFVEYVEITVEGEDGTITTEGQIVLSDYAIHAMDAEGNTIAGFTTVEEWMADTQGAWYTLNKDFNGAIINKSMILDLNGHSLTNLILGQDVVLTIIDTTTDDYDCEDGYGTVTLNAANMGTITTGTIKTTVEQIGAIKSYMILVEDGVYSAHRYYVGITKVTLKTGDKGFGYKARFAGDQKVQEQLSRFGFRLWLGDSTNVVVRALNMSKFDSAKEFTLLLKDFDIIGYGDVAVNAEVFMTLKDGGELASSTVSYSMKTMLQKINETLESFTEAQILAIQGMLTEEEKAVMAQWGIDALLTWTAPVTPEEDETTEA